MKDAKICMFFLTLCSTFLIQEAYPISIDEFINSAVTDDQLVDLSHKADLLKHPSANTPFINKLQLRYQFEDYFYKNQYSLRFYFNGIGETSSAKKILNLTKEISRLQSDILLSMNFKDRYILVADLYCLNNLNKHFIEMNRLYINKVNALKNIIGNRKKNFDDLFKAEVELDNNQIETIEIEESIKGTENKIRAIIRTEEKISFDYNNIITTDNMKKNLDDNKAMFTINSGSNIYLLNEIKDLELTKEELENIESEERRYIDFIDVGVDTDNKLRGENDELKATFGIGVNMPFISSKSTNINRKKSDILNKTGAFLAYKKELQMNIDNLLIEFNSLNKQLILLSNANSNKNANKYLSSFQQIEGTDPIVIVNIRENMIKRDIKIESLKHEIFLLYFEILDQSGTLIQNKAKNYILN